MRAAESYLRRTLVRRWALVFFALSLGGAATAVAQDPAQAAPPRISAVDAKDYIGQEATVCGVVVSAGYVVSSRDHSKVGTCDGALNGWGAEKTLP
jgi:hypothetical protein